MALPDVFRILIVDDNPSIHQDFEKILVENSGSEELNFLEKKLFGKTKSENFATPKYEIDSAMQGEEAVAMFAQSLSVGRPYSMAFVDMRMPPGIDGVETIEKLWAVNDQLQVVICSAYSDYSWQETITRLGWTDRLLILRKPFDKIEVCQLALALSVKFKLENVARLRADKLRDMVAQRTCELEAETERRQLLESKLLQWQSDLKIDASIDELTQLQNKKAITERLLKLGEQANFLQLPFSILLVGVENFQSINDSYGQLAGDYVLAWIADSLKTGLRATDAVGRFGCEEFIVGILNCDSSHANSIADTLIGSVDRGPVSFEGKEISVTISIGTATSGLKDFEANELIGLADKAKCRPKTNACNQVEQNV